MAFIKLSLDWQCFFQSVFWLTIWALKTMAFGCSLFQLVLLMDFGVQSSLKTKIPVFVHQGDWLGLKAFVGSIYKISFGIAAAIFIFFLMLTKVIDFKSAFNIHDLSLKEVNFLFFFSGGLVGINCSAKHSFFRLPKTNLYKCRQWRSKFTC